MGNKKEFFIGIDLGGRNKKTTGICVLERGEEGISFSDISCSGCEDVAGKEALKKIKPFLKETRAIAVDAPLTRGRGKGKMRLYEKFLSTKVFREAKINPLPPVLMKEFCDFAEEFRMKLEREGFVQDVNLIEVFPTMVNKVCGDALFSGLLKKGNYRCPRETENQRSAFVCAALAYLHFNFKTRYLGYRDGFLFLPELSFWKNSWKENFYKAWKEKPYLNYRRLITNIFNDYEPKILDENS